jgi:quinol monooxygenase YgiN
MISVVAKNIVKNNRTEEFKSLAKEMIKETLKEKGCIEYSIYEDSEKNNILTFIEKWENMEVLKAHFETPHFKKIVPQFQELSEGGDINIYKEI